MYYLDHLGISICETPIPRNSIPNNNVVVDPSQQQWMAMQQYQATMHSQPQSVDEIKTLWIGDLQYWMDENYLYTCFAQSGEVCGVNLLKGLSQTTLLISGILNSLFLPALHLYFCLI